jgi:hypothetical protein
MAASSARATRVVSPTCSTPAAPASPLASRIPRS